MCSPANKHRLPTLRCTGKVACKAISLAGPP